MSNSEKSANFDKAKQEADKIDAEIINTLQEGLSFRVEAGAGSGKTYSLNRVIEWIQTNKWSEFEKKKQNVICITYTNAAVEVIAERLSQDSFVIPSTIHSFAWNAIKQYQSTILSFIENNDTFQTEETDFSKVVTVSYTLGHRYVSKGIHYLYHDDVLKLFCMFLENEKYRRVFTDKYPLILIDEYQDSYKPIIELFIKYFIEVKQGPQFGFFGDAWQTIYQSNKACGEIEHDNIKVIKKVSNFRSAPRIVQFLNDIRPELPQYSAIDDFEGEVIVVTCDDYNGDRRMERNFTGELPVIELRNRLSGVTETIKRRTSNGESLKTLMITHKVLASQQGYERLLEILADGLRDKQDPFLLFFMNTVEPIYDALKKNDMQLLFDTLGVKRYPITKKAEKEEWKKLELLLNKVREQKTIDVLNAVIDSELVPISPQIEGYMQLYKTGPETMYSSNATIKELLELDYGQFLAAIDFLYPEAEFSTEHGVKGEEYDNVIFVISKGWNQYQFEIYAPMINGMVSVPNGKEAAYIRNRNLFYVCCSRPKKRLVLFVTVEISTEFRSFLISLIGADNIYTYNQFVASDKEG